MSGSFRRTYRWLWITPVILSLIALFPLPYGYYQLLRIVVCGTAIAVALLVHRPRGEGGWLAATLLIAALFNPIIPVHLTREIWSVLNLATVAVFAASWWTAGRETGDS